MSNVTSMPAVRTGAVEPITHGGTTATWSPEGGGTASISYDRPHEGIAAATGAAAIGIGLAGIVKAGHGARAARAAATTAGLGAEAIARAGSRAGGRTLLAATAIGFGVMAGGRLLANAFSTEEHSSKPMSREEFEEARTTTASLQSGIGTKLAIGALGTVAGVGSAVAAAKLLSKAPAPVAIAGMGAAAVGGLLGGIWGAGKLIDATS